MGLPMSSQNGGSVGAYRHRTSIVLGTVAIAAIMAPVCPAAPAADPPITLISQTILSGSAGWIGNSCSRLTASIGQPVPGSSFGGGFTLTTGFRAVIPAGDGETIFFDGVEECSP